MSVEPKYLNGPKNMIIKEPIIAAHWFSPQTWPAQTEQNNYKNPWSVVVNIEQRMRLNGNSNEKLFCTRTFCTFIDGANKNKSCWRQKLEIHTRRTSVKKYQQTNDKSQANRVDSFGVVSSNYLAFILAISIFFVDGTHVNAKRIKCFPFI